MEVFCLYGLLLLLFLSISSSFPLCTDLRAPSVVNGSLEFCNYRGKTCCSVSRDGEIQKRFQAMNVSDDSSCASAIKSILCAECDPFSAALLDTGPNARPVPLLCNSSTATATATGTFCSSVWRSCRNVPISNSPFAPALQSKAQILPNTTVSKLADLWSSESDFCGVFGGIQTENSTCFDGAPLSLNATDTTPPPAGICLEKLGDGAYINMVPHPDGSGRAFFSTLAGKVLLATIPEQDSGDAMALDQSSPFVDLTDQVYLDTSFGMMGLAFHPDFAANGRFFASFNCDRQKSPTCGGTCACNSDVGCDPSSIRVPDAGEVCRYQSVIAEYSANGTVSTPSEATSARPQEVRRIFTMGLPFTSGHGGQILFGPADGYLYFMMGDGSGKGDPYNFAQNKRSLLGKIMRLDVDNIPNEEELVKLARWGNYSVPRDNPYSEDKGMQPEIWAYGLRNPWRCSFDSERPSYFVCADVGQDKYEEVDIISKGGNYGWRVYEGPLTFHPQSAPGGNTSADSIDPIFPVLGYGHSNINKLGAAAITGGYFYRSRSDPCTCGSYLYADLYANHIWAAQETPRNSGNFTAKDVPFSCASDSPVKCDAVPGSRLPALQYIFSFGEDNRKDVFILAQSGVYRVVRPSRCNFTCSKEVETSANSHHRSPSGGHCVDPSSTVLGFACVVLLFVGILL